jgi:hypothetical protein
MLHLANNYSYRFLRDDAKVFAICKKKKLYDTLIINVNDKQNAIINPLRYQYYSEPVIGRDGVTRNTLLSFANQELCSIWKDRLIRHQNKLIDQDKDKDKDKDEDNKNKHHYQDLEDDTADATYHDTFSNELHEISFTLHDVKSVSDELRLALIVILDMRDNEYEIYYHNFKHKQRNF